ncbi:hypothetical protein HYDPIDRAFT_170881 [Hydnomerulius pinastri MD-312]|uniref:F-box domain-containing protein n=1 Tax=Hydnomerulius pinastri MD-312 TaxID=994086 RepID=A0A0C9VNQ6_9AGAM|nr:hypothetical protein HYDPIDRAFT_170881 [Hydnomerulius pinastri MD-312]
MHHCLNIAEIQQLIFEYVRGPVLFEGRLDYRQRQATASARGALAALALTCRSFTEPALDLLWYDLDTFEPLFKSLPLDLWPEGRYPWRPLRETTFSRDLQPSDWTCLQKYCSRVRILGRLVDNVDREQPLVSGSVPAVLLEALFRQPHGATCIFPRLEKLFWNDGREAMFQYFSRFLAPTLTCIRVATEDWTADKSSSLRALEAHCPRLNDFGFFFPGSGYFFTDTQIDEFSETIRNLQPVERLSVCAVDHYAYRHLTSLSALKSLSIHLACTMDYYCPVEIVFPETLETIDLHTYHLVFVLKLLANKRFSSRHLNIRSRYHYPVKNLASFFEQLHDHFSPDHLTTLSLDIEEAALSSSSFSDIGSQSTLDVQSLPILFEFRLLRGLKLAAYWSPDLDDDWMADIASALPNLEVLDLGTESTCDLSQLTLGITMRGVISLIDALPQLRELGLVFDARLSSLPAAYEYWGITNRSLTTLRVGTSPIDMPSEVASRLSSLLPSLKQVDFSSHKYLDSQLDTVRCRWDQVSELLQTYSRAKAVLFQPTTVEEESISPAEFLPSRGASVQVDKFVENALLWDVLI